MKVKELIARLQELDPELLVVLSADEEGNRYQTLEVVEGDNSVFTEDRELRLHHITPELESRGYTEEDDVDEGEPCVVLWP